MLLRLSEIPLLLFMYKDLVGRCFKYLIIVPTYIYKRKSEFVCLFVMFSRFKGSTDRLKILHRYTLSGVPTENDMEYLLSC